MKSGFLLLLSILSFCQALPGQGIDYAYVIPSNPTASDTVRLVTAVWLPSGECWDETFAILENQDHFDVTVGYNSGLLTVICHAEDTFELGRLDPGSYSGVYTAMYPYPAVSWTDTAHFTFVVGGTTGVSEVWREGWKVSPNPAPGEFYLSVPTGCQQEGSRISLHDLSGRRCWLADLGPGEAGRKLSPDLNAGCYVLFLETASGRHARFPLILTQP